LDLFHIAIALLFLSFQSSTPVTEEKNNQENKESSSTQAKQNLPEKVQVPDDNQQKEKEIPIKEELMKRSLITEKDGIKWIRIATTLPLSDEYSVIGKEISTGMNLVFNKVNRSGGINGIQIKLYMLNDENKFYRCKENIKKMLQKTPILISLFGSNSMMAATNYVKKSEAIVLFPIYGSRVLRKKLYRGIIYFRPSERSEIEKLIEFSINSRGRQSIGVFYEKSIWGEAALETTRELLKEKYNLDLASEGYYPQNTVQISGAIESIMSGGPSAVISIASPRANYNFIRDAMNKGMYRCLFMGISTLIVSQKTLFRARGITMITSSTVPDPNKSKLQIAEIFRSDAREAFPTKQLTTFMLEGYINALLLVEVLKRIKGELTIRSLIEKLESIKNVSLKGIPLEFGKKEPRTLSNKVWLCSVSQQKEEK